jgi:hypothetical protein
MQSANSRDYSFSRWTLHFNNEEYEERFFQRSIEKNLVGLNKQLFFYIFASIALIILLLAWHVFEPKLTVYPSIVIVTSIATLIIITYTPQLLNKVLVCFKL